MLVKGATGVNSPNISLPHDTYETWLVWRLSADHMPMEEEFEFQSCGPGLEWEELHHFMLSHYCSNPKKYLYALVCLVLAYRTIIVHCVDIYIYIYISYFNESGNSFTIHMASYQYRTHHYKNKAVYYYNGDAYILKDPFDIRIGFRVPHANELFLWD